MSANDPKRAIWASSIGFHSSLLGESVQPIDHEVLSDPRLMISLLGSDGPLATLAKL